LFGLFAAPAINLSAQEAARETSHWSLGIRGNIPYYRVDPIRNEGHVFKELHWGIGGVLEYTINPLWGFGLSVDYLNINRGGYRGSASDWTAQTIDVGLFTSVNLLNLLSPNRTRWHRGGIYANIGAGAAFYSHDVRVEGNRGGIVDDNSISAFGMVGVNVEFPLNNTFHVMTGVQYRNYNRENLGGWVSPNMRGNDALIANVGLRVNFNANSRDHVRNTRPLTDQDAINALRRDLEQLQRQADRTADNVDNLGRRLNDEIVPLREQNRAQQEEIDELRRRLDALGQGQAFVIEGVLFRFDSAVLTAEGAIILDRVARVIRDNNMRVNVVGHTCDMGSTALNDRLSLARANTVREALIERGVPAGNIIETFGVGYTEPRASNATAAGRQQNRRVEIIPQ